MAVTSTRPPMRTAGSSLASWDQSMTGQNPAGQTFQSQQQKQQAQAAYQATLERQKREQLQRDQSSLFSLANSKSAVSARTIDPLTGSVLEYGGLGSGRGSGSGSGTDPDAGPVDFSSAWAKTQQMTPPPMPALPAREPGVSQEDRTAAENAEFSKAKDVVGRTGRASLNALSGEMRARGISGSGINAQGIANAVDKASGQLGNVGLTNAIEALKRQAQISDENYAGGMQQRGQDIGYNEALGNRDTSVMNARGSMTSNLLSLMQRNGGRLY